MSGQPHQQRPDIDSLCKALMDAVLDHDSRVMEIHATKFWTDGNGAIEVEEIKT